MLTLPCSSDGQPDPEALRAALRRPGSPISPLISPISPLYLPYIYLYLRHPGSRVRAVTVVSPSNPSGAVCGRATGAALLEACAEAGAWLIADEAYEHFVHEGPPHSSLASLPGAAGLVISLHTMSKSYGLAGWRVGSICYPSRLHEALLKVQDTISPNPNTKLTLTLTLSLTLTLTLTLTRYRTPCPHTRPYTRSVSRSGCSPIAEP